MPIRGRLWLADVVAYPPCTCSSLTGVNSPIRTPSAGQHSVGGDFSVMVGRCCGIVLRYGARKKEEKYFGDATVGTRLANVKKIPTQEKRTSAKIGRWCFIMRFEILSFFTSLTTSKTMWMPILLGLICTYQFLPKHFINISCNPFRSHFDVACTLHFLVLFLSVLVNLVKFCRSLIMSVCTANLVKF